MSMILAQHHHDVILVVVLHRQCAHHVLNMRNHIVLVHVLHTVQARLQRWRTPPMSKQRLPKNLEKLFKFLLVLKYISFQSEENNCKCATHFKHIGSLFVSEYTKAKK